MSENLENIDNRINSLWRSGAYVEAGIAIANELVPTIVDYLVSRKGLSRQDAEDAVGEAHLGFLKHVSKNGPQSISAPKPILWQAAEWRAEDIRRKNRESPIPESQIVAGDDKRLRGPHEFIEKQFRSAATNGMVPSWQLRATYLVEGLFEGTEVKPSDAPRLVLSTINRLAPGNAAILKHILEYGLDQPAADAALALNITANNFGVRKCRAYKEFRTVAPLVASELGIEWRGITDEPVSADAIEIPEFVPSEEEDTGPAGSEQ